MFSQIRLHLKHNLWRKQLWKRPSKHQQSDNWPKMPPLLDRCSEAARWGVECIFWHISLHEPMWLRGSLHFSLSQSKHWHICILIEAHLCLLYPAAADAASAEWPDADGAVLRNLEVVLTADKSAEQTCWSSSGFTRRPTREERYLSPSKSYLK